jgi:hypothetical protein
MRNMLFAKKTPLLIIFSGESNSGGQVPNTSATAQDLAVKNNLPILNNTTLQFEPLQIGVNNTIDHFSMVFPPIWHGWELGLSNAIDNGDFGSIKVRLIKTGHGGSRIAQWNTGGSYYTKFLARINAAKSLMPRFRAVMWYTQGINDGVAGTDIAVWKAATIAHFAKIRLELPNIPILFTDVTPSSPQRAAYSAAIAEICSEVDKCYFISTAGAALQDVYHWNYDGMKLIASRLVAQTKVALIS